MDRIVLFFFLAMLGSFNVFCQPVALKRVAEKGFTYTSTPKGLLINTISSPLLQSSKDLQKGDLIVKVGDQYLDNYLQASRYFRNLKSDSLYQLTILRGQDTLKCKLKFPPKDVEIYQNTQVEYGTLPYRQINLRTIVSVPKQKTTKKKPGILLVQWLSCASIDFPHQAEDGFDHLVKSFASDSGFVFYRVEKQGVGDSEGSPCIDCDALSEIEIYKAALKNLKQRPEVDTSNIFILGLSLGASLAPIVGLDENIRGYMVSGGLTRTWFEHMLSFEYNRLSLSSETDSLLNEKMKMFTTIYYEMLINHKSIHQIFIEKPALKEVWYDQENHQFGRTATYYQQVQALNFEQNWQKVKKPVLVLYGEYDWIMSREDHIRIAEIVNNNQKGLAKYVLLPQTSHLLVTYPSLKECFNDQNGKINQQPYDLMNDWVRSILSKD